MEKTSKFTAAALPSVVAVVFFGLILGWRGVSAAGIQWVELIQIANDAALNNKPWSLATPHPGLDLLGIPLLAIGEANRLQVLGWVSVICTGLTLPAVWLLGKRVGGDWAAISACVFFLGIPVVSGTATTTSPAAIVLLMWAWIFALTSRPSLDWLGWGVVAVLAALLSVSWPPFLIWLVGWFAVIILNGARQSGATDNESQSPGLIGASAIPLGALLPIVAAVLAPVLVAQLGAGDLKTGFDALLRQGILPEAEAITFAGDVYSSSRPPIITGLVWWGIQTPAVVVVLSLVGFVGGTERGRSWLDKYVPTHVEQGFALGLVPMTLAFLWLIPWLTRSRAFGGVDPILLAQPIMAALAGAAITWIVAGLVERFRDSMSGRALATVAGILGAAAFLPGLVETARAHPLQSAYYNIFVGGTDGAVERGFPVWTDDTLPIKVATTLEELAGTRPVDPGAFRPQLRGLVSDGVIAPLAFAERNQPAKIRLRAGSGADPDRDKPFKRATWRVDDVTVFEVLVLDPPPLDDD